MSDIRTDPKPDDQAVNLALIEPLLMEWIHDDDLLRAALDDRLTWLAEPFDESGYRLVNVMFRDEAVAVARFHWSDLLGDDA